MRESTEEEAGHGHQEVQGRTNRDLAAQCSLCIREWPVVTENSVRSENTGVRIIREIMVATTMSSLFVALFALLASSFRTRAALQAEILALRHQLAVFQKNAPRRLRTPPLRPAVVGFVVPILVRLAAMSSDGSARHGPPLAP